MGSHRSRSRSRSSCIDRAGDTRHGRRLHMDISLSWDLFMDVGLSSNLLINRGSRQRSPGSARRR